MTHWNTNHLCRSATIYMRTTYRCDNRKCCDDAVQPTEDDGFDVSENGNGRAEVEKILKPHSTWI